MKCPLCGHEFDESSVSSCSSCPMHSDSCSQVCCPNCGYSFPQKSKLVESLKKVVKFFRR